MVDIFSILLSRQILKIKSTNQLDVFANRVMFLEQIVLSDQKQQR